jgi:mRNA-degrading endonuclease RelE of RelBE toxin-antitoxin system
MSEYKVYHCPETKEFFDSLDDKSKRIFQDHFKELVSAPHTWDGHRDKEKLVVSGVELYRMHVSRTWTIFYTILEEKKQVRLVEILTIDEAHEKYGY